MKNGEYAHQGLHKHAQEEQTILKRSQKHTQTMLTRRMKPTCTLPRESNVIPCAWMRGGGQQHGKKENEKQRTTTSVKESWNCMPRRSFPREIVAAHAEGCNGEHEHEER
jgi:hypothetical protein